MIPFFSQEWMGLYGLTEGFGLPIDAGQVHFGSPQNDWVFALPETEEVHGQGGHDVLSLEKMPHGFIVSLEYEYAFHPVGFGFNFEDIVDVTGIEHVVGTSFGDYIVADEGHNMIAGLDGNDVIAGHGGHDYLLLLEDNDTGYGGAGDDLIIGGDGEDRLYGGIGDDYLLGDADRDVLFGGQGTDSLEGGQGADVFVFNYGDMGNTFTDDADVIIDLTLEDQILLPFGVTYGGDSWAPGNDEFTLWYKAEAGHHVISLWGSGYEEIDIQNNDLTYSEILSVIATMNSPNEYIA